MFFTPNFIIARSKYVFRYKVKITFDNGEQTIADFSQWLKGEVFEPLKDKTYFLKFLLTVEQSLEASAQTLHPKLFISKVNRFCLETPVKIKKSESDKFI